MPRYAKRTDDNHKCLVEELRDALPEATIFDASGAGRGCQDLVIGWQGKNYLIEVKDPTKTASRRQLTEAQRKMHSSWQGQINVCLTAAEICATILRIETK